MVFLMASRKIVYMSDFGIIEVPDDAVYSTTKDGSPDRRTKSGKMASAYFSHIDDLVADNIAKGGDGSITAPSWSGFKA